MWTPICLAMTSSKPQEGDADDQDGQGGAGD
jgi:hypothetical protein